MKFRVVLPLLILAFGTVFFLLNCNGGGTKDKCEGVICYNGGVCVEGICNCPSRYTGQFCENEVPPTSIDITKFTINGFPATKPNGSPWDKYDGPDLYVVLKQGNNIVYRYHKTILNANPGTKYEMAPLEIVKVDPFKDYTMELWDDDKEEGQNDDFMQKTIAFKPFREGKKFPDTINVKSFMWDLDISLHLRYHHD